MQDSSHLYLVLQLAHGTSMQCERTITQTQTIRNDTVTVSVRVCARTHYLFFFLFFFPQLPAGFYFPSFFFFLITCIVRVACDCVKTSQNKKYF